MSLHKTGKAYELRVEVVSIIDHRMQAVVVDNVPGRII
jgi:hypothetical protein